MPHKNFVGDDIITLNNAKIVQKNFTVLSKVNLNIKRGTFCYIIGKQALEKFFAKSSLRSTSLKEGEGEVVGFDLKN
jgi:cell division transport system ATP-binding protein